MDIWKTKLIFSPEIIADLRRQVDPPNFQPQQNMPGGYNHYGGDNGYNQGGNQMASIVNELNHNSGGKYRNVSPPRSNYMVLIVIDYSIGMISGFFFSRLAY